MSKPLWKSEGQLLQSPFLVSANLGWILLIFVVLLSLHVPENFCFLEIFVRGHPGPFHTICHLTNGWQLNKKFSGQRSLEKALLKNVFQVSFFGRIISKTLIY